MLRINSLNYNCSAESVGDNDVVLANLGFNADSYSNYYFNINIHKKEDITSAIVLADFDEFREKAAEVADTLSENIEIVDTTPGSIV